MGGWKTVILPCTEITRIQRQKRTSERKMPKSSQYSLPKIRATRIFIAVVCLILLTTILWLVYFKWIAKTSLGAESSGNAPVQVSGVYMVEGLGNFEPPDEPRKSGPGEGGKPHKLRSDLFSKERWYNYLYGMNILCSDEIALNRSIPDLRNPECKHWQYPENLPKASVIISFHYEGFSTLMRTVHSVMNRSPPQLLEEVLLIDDNNNSNNKYEDLRYKTEYYIMMWKGKVRLVHNEHREGVIISRSRGVKYARGEVIIFLDAHCEVGKNWLPPLLAPIRANPKTMTVPVIDKIHSFDFHVRPVHAGHRLFKGIFDWGMIFKEKELSKEEIAARAHHTLPYRSPTIAGGIFAINRVYFLELGTFDPGLIMYGGENFEISFKIWQCGGSILSVPCSRVAHVDRITRPYSFGKLLMTNEGPLVAMNHRRVVETWMDDKYKEYFYTREPAIRFHVMGNITKQLQLKERLKCKSFQWFMDNVAPDLTTRYPVPPPNVHWGELENVGRRRCLNAAASRVPTKLRALHCSNGYFVNQRMRLNVEGQLTIGQLCIVSENHRVKVDFCQDGSVSGHWQYDDSTRVVYNSMENMCLALNNQTSNMDVDLKACDPTDNRQQWKFIETIPDMY